MCVRRREKRWDDWKFSDDFDLEGWGCCGDSIFFQPPFSLFHSQVCRFRSVLKPTSLWVLLNRLLGVLDLLRENIFLYSLWVLLNRLLGVFDLLRKNIFLYSLWVLLNRLLGVLDLLRKNLNLYSLWVLLKRLLCVETHFFSNLCPSPVVCTEYICWV